MAALASPGDPIACLFPREKRTRRRAHLFLDQCPALARKNECRPRRDFARPSSAWPGIFGDRDGRPQLGTSLTQVEASGIDIMLVLDVSQSMLTKDFRLGGPGDPRRSHSRSHPAVHRSAANDRIGIIAFAGHPCIVSPMTLDHDWLLQNLDRVRTGLVEDGTAIRFRDRLRREPFE